MTLDIQLNNQSLRDILSGQPSITDQLNVVFPALYDQNAEADKVAIDLLARTYKASGEKYWYRFEPGTTGFGLQVFPRIVPKEIWAFQVGVNLTAASYEESIEETATVVRLVNR